MLRLAPSNDFSICRYHKPLQTSVIHSFTACESSTSTQVVRRVYNGSDFDQTETAHSLGPGFTLQKFETCENMPIFLFYPVSNSVTIACDNIHRQY